MPHKESKPEASEARGYKAREAWRAEVGHACGVNRSC
jgi:hypothetical protein